MLINKHDATQFTRVVIDSKDRLPVESLFDFSVNFAHHDLHVIFWCFVCHGQREVCRLKSIDLTFTLSNCAAGKHLRNCTFSFYTMARLSLEERFRAIGHLQAGQWVTHVARNVMVRNNINVIAPWPAISPDLNPIEHVWDIMGRQLRLIDPQPQNNDQLFDCLRNAWNNIPQQQLSTLIGSMRRRCTAVVNANGGLTQYWLFSYSVSWYQKPTLFLMNFYYSINN